MGRRKAPKPKAFAPPEPWKSFLEELDSLLRETVDLHCIGGFVVTLHYGISRATSDIDVLPTLPAEQREELQRVAGEGSALHRKHRVYIESVGIVSFPENYDSRLIRLWPGFGLKCIRMFALEAHDLALTKLERNLDQDREDVHALAAAGLLDPRTLRVRYETELRPNLFSSPEKNDLTLELWIEMCWPSSAGAD